jgi:hypothetical protein
MRLGALGVVGGSGDAKFTQSEQRPVRSLLRLPSSFLRLNYTVQQLKKYGVHVIGRKDGTLSFPDFLSKTICNRIGYASLIT